MMDDSPYLLHEQALTGCPRAAADLGAAEGEQGRRAPWTEEAGADGGEEWGASRPSGSDDERGKHGPPSHTMALITSGCGQNQVR